MSRRQHDLFPELPDGKKYVSDIPELLTDWHPAKNGHVLPADILGGSGIPVWWKCALGHEWQASPNQRTNRGSGCPDCYNLIRSDNTRKATPELSLLTEQPTLCLEWHPTLNEHPPEFYMPRSMDKVWWQCEQGHEWRAAIDSRTRGNGCKYCAGQAATADRNFAVLFPKIAKEWDYTKNELPPEEYTPYSNYKVWWRCSKGHSYESAVYSRAAGRGCPKCTNQQSRNELRILSELQFLFSDVQHRKKISCYEVDVLLPSLNLAIEYDGWYWHRSKDKNDRAKQKALEKVGVNLIRVREMPLPRIGAKDILVDGRNFLTKYDMDEIIAALDVKGAKIDEYLLATEFRHDDLYEDYLSYFPSPLPSRSLLNLAPHLVEHWHPTKNKALKPENFTAHSGHKAWWICDFGHEYKAAIRNRFDGSGCPKCSGRVAASDTCLAATHAELAALWHFTKNGQLTPHNTKAGSGKKIWWKCSQGHEWQASPVNMKKHNRRSYCPHCYKPPIPERVENCMAETHPEMTAALHPTKNEPFTAYNLKAGSKRTLWWVCSNDPKHEWQALSYNQKKSPFPDLCPECTLSARWRKIKGE